MSQKKLTDFMKKNTNNDKSKSSSNAQKIQPNETTRATTVEQLTIEEDKHFILQKIFVFQNKNLEKDSAFVKLIGSTVSVVTLRYKVTYGLIFQFPHIFYNF